MEEKIDPMKQENNEPVVNTEELFDTDSREAEKIRAAFDRVRVDEKALDAAIENAKAKKVTPFPKARVAAIAAAAVVVLALGVTIPVLTHVFSSSSSAFDEKAAVMEENEAAMDGGADAIVDEDFGVGDRVGGSGGASGSSKSASSGGSASDRFTLTLNSVKSAKASGIEITPKTAAFSKTSEKDGVVTGTLSVLLSASCETEAPMAEFGYSTDADSGETVKVNGQQIACDSLILTLLKTGSDGAFEGTLEMTLSMKANEDAEMEVMLPYLVAMDEDGSEHHINGPLTLAFSLAGEAFS